MTLIFQIIGLAFIGTVAFQVLKQVKPEFSIFILIVTGCAILIALSDSILTTVDVFRSLSEKAGLENAVFSSILKIIGIGYVTEYSAGICEDSGSGSLAKKIQFAGKLIIFIMAIPIVSGVIDIIGGLL